jgi:heme exporter protein A
MRTEAAPAAQQLMPPEDRSPAIVVDGLVRRFGEREALSGVSFALEEAQTLAVFGPNGAGKTTLLRVLATLLLPHRGTVRVLGLELPRDAHALRPRIGMLAHDPLLYHDLTGRENLRFYARLYGVDSADRRIEDLLAATGMSARADEPVRSLSRGMAQRLAICRTVLHGPRLMLLDEPHSHLDPGAAALVEPLIGRASGATRLIVSHEVERALEEADRVLLLRGGRVVVDAAAVDVAPSGLRGLFGGPA